MTTPSSALPQGARDTFDAGPLFWVMNEIREALGRCAMALADAVAQDAEARSTSLRLARTHLHQAHGALQVIDVEGVTIITETIEALFDSVASGKMALTQDVAHAIEQACQALAAYLEELLSGGNSQPIRLFPYYKDLLEARGADKIHPVELFFPNLSLLPRLPTAPANALSPAAHASMRQRFEKALLLFLKGAGGAEAANVAVMRDVVGEIEACAPNHEARAFWWVLHGFAEAVCAGQIPGEVFVKQLFGRINLQIRRLGQDASATNETLLRDALFYLAQAKDPSPKVRQIREAYHLNGMVPADYAEKRYGQIDARALATAKERLAQAKNLWNRIAAGDASVAQSFEHEMHGLAQAGSRLNSEPLTKLLRELGGIARHAAHASPDDRLSLELATSLLFVEHALNHIGRRTEDFAERAEAMTARLLSVVSGEQPASAAQWLDDMSRQAQQRQTMAALAGEMQSSLRQVERMLDEYFRNPLQRGSLERLDGMLHQIEGALAILDQDDAVRTVQHTRDAVRRFMENESGAARDANGFGQVAQNIGALGFFIESLQHDSEQAPKRFHFDEERGVFVANLIERETADQDHDHDPAPEPGALSIGKDDAASSAAVPDAPPSLAAASAAETQSEEAIDAELLDIFLSEAEEVLGCIGQTLPCSEEQPHNQEYLATLRRSFHTLKGSGRMVGLTAFGEAAWSIEQVLNLRLSESRSGDADLYALLAKAAGILRAWVQDLRLQGRSALSPQALVNAAERIKAGESFLFEEEPKSAASGEAAPALATALPFAEAKDDPVTDGMVGATAPDVELQASDGAALLEEIETPAALAAEMPAPDTAAQSVDLQLLTPDDGIPLDDAAAVPAESASAPKPLSDAAEVIEFPTLAMPAVVQNDNIKRIGDLDISLPLYNIYMAETDELVRVLAQDVSEWRHEPARQVNVLAVHAAHSLAGSSATVGFSVLHELAYALEMVLQFLARMPVRMTIADIDAIGLSVERLRSKLRKFALGEMPDQDPAHVRVLTRLLRDLEARARLMHVQTAPAQAEPGPGLEDELAAAADYRSDGNDPVADVAAEARYAEDEPAADATALPKNDLDADLLPVFLEEARDMLPQVGQALRSWKEQPADAHWPQALMRLLHTVKGSARMAGAMALGQYLHDTETRIGNIMRLGAPSPATMDDLLLRYDQALQLFEELQNPGARKQRSANAHANDANADSHSDAGSGSLADAGESGPVVLSALMPLAANRPVASDVPPERTGPVAASQMVRVRADILDRLVNQAGEVSITRSKLETEVGSLRQSLSELTENVTRLREQLREIEMQAETQITSRMAHSADREFDPLEFDRFTRLQELTRMMAESVSDVGTVQHGLSRMLDAASGDLALQARLTRELQQDLMRVRMVPFGSITERLYRVTRQAAKEVDKRVNLDIHGGAVEMDRGVLERMTGPFEHLLRNAIVHGIESREARRLAGKSETGELQIEIRQEGNEVAIRFSDDGQGLNLGVIRSKARQVGLLSDDRELSEEEVSDLIFHPGFSTAEEITELAGRGVGMDVVRSEAAVLGGRVAVHSEPGKGAHFTIRLPLTLAVTQVVLLSGGGKVYAVPSVLVEQVQQLKANALAAAYNDGAVVWQGQRVALHYLPALLGDIGASPVAQQYSPLMILKSGNERVALHVDEIIGNREVVVKNIGPQLARMAGIAGATVLGSGEIVLILNPVALVQRDVRVGAGMPRIGQADTSAAMGAVAEMGAAQPSAPVSEPVQGLRTRNTVMVVDDSLTVRRVTQRLLAREGYQVVLAKDGVEALEHLQSLTPDVMLVDIEMPRMDGFDLTRNVRDDERTRAIPIIMITSRTAAKHRNYALELGVDEYLGKPYQEEHLLGLIAAFVGRKEAAPRPNQDS